RIHQGAVGQVEWGAGGGVAGAEVDLPGTQVGGFQVGGNAGLVERRVVGAQQRGAGALALPLWADSEDGQVTVGDTGRVVPVERRVEGQEPAGPGTCRDGEPCVIVQGLGWPVLAHGYPQRRCGAVRGGVDHTTGHGVLDVDPEVAGEDLLAGGRVIYQPPRRRQIVEGPGDD